eukprot:4428174-Amphidinium_carterae.1
MNHQQHPYIRYTATLSVSTLILMSVSAARQMTGCDTMSENAAMSAIVTCRAYEQDWTSVGNEGSAATAIRQQQEFSVLLAQRDALLLKCNSLFGLVLQLKKTRVTSFSRLARYTGSIQEEEFR